MDINTAGKKSQKRKDRQERKAERRKAKAEQQLRKPEKKKPVKARLSKKSLPGFLAKNVNAIIQWLKDYETLFVLADDYGIQRLDRMPKEKRDMLFQNYIDVSDFITVLQEIVQETNSANAGAASESLQEQQSNEDLSMLSEELS